MLKKLLLILLQVLGCILFIVTLLTSGILKLYVFNDSAFYYSILLIAPLFLLPAFQKNRMNSYAIVVAGLMMLEGATQFMDRIRGIDQFNYQLGNTSGPLRILLQHEAAQGMMKEIVSTLPSQIVTRVYTAENDYRIHQIKKHVGMDYSAFKLILLKANEAGTLDAGGNILMMSVGTEVINNSKMTPIEKKIHLFELSQAMLHFIKSAENKDEQNINKFHHNLVKSADQSDLFSDIDQQLAAGKLTKSQAVAYKLRIHQFSSEL